MIKRILTFVLILSYQILSGAVSNPEKIHFNHLFVEDGLSGNIVNKIIEDSYGYIWIGTSNGLNRYDGTSVTVFYHDPHDSTSLSGNMVSGFAVDRDKNLWIGTKNGLCRFNYETETFERYLQNGPGELNFISSLYVDTKGQIWVGTERGIFTFDKYSHQFTKIIVDDEITLFAPMCFTELSDGTLLVGLWEKGFYIISENRSNKTREVIELGANKSAGLNTIMSVLVDKNSTLWMATREGVIKANKTQELGKSKYDYSLFINELSVEDQIADMNTHSLCEDNDGNIWIGTENGLSIFHPATRNNVNCFNDPTDPYSLSNNAIRCIFKDSNGNIWIGTYQGGVSVYHPSQQWFLNYFPAINNSFDQKMRSVKVIYQDCNGILWVGTDNGLLKFSENGQLIETYINVPSDPNSINVGGVTALREDRMGRFWVGTWGGGVHELNRKTGKFERLPWVEGVNDSPLSQGDINTKSIAEDSKGNLWIGNIRGYLDKYNPETRTFKHFRITLNELDINAIIKDVTVDKNDNVWLGTEGAGLIRFDSENEQIARFGNFHHPEEQPDTIPDITDVYALFFADDDHLWLGTSNGVHVLNLKTMGWTSYTTDDGLPENTVYTIQSDDYGKFWISSISSISSFDPLNGVFTNYDGLEGIRINSDCSFKSKSGWLYFGGINGINALNPFTIKENRVIPPVVFTDLKIFNQSVAIGKNSILKKHINLTDKIIIPYRDNNITIEFAALNFINSEKNQYKCRLEGFDRDWDQLGTARTARYTNLSPGDYTFQVTASNNDGVWNMKGRSIEIEILPPWWKTLWFRLLTLFILLLVILSLILVRTYRLREQKKKLKILVVERTSEIESQKIKLQEQSEKLLQTNQLLEEQKNKISKQRQREKEMSEKLHEADQMKLRFFTNISHEFRTPLTLIQGPAEMLIKEFSSDPRFAELGAIMHRNTIRMLQLINQFLDLSKIEAGVLKLKISEADIFTNINGIVHAYRFIASQKNITYNYYSTKDSHKCYFDADKIEKILYNLLSNAFKYTPQNGWIHILIDFIGKEENPSEIQIKVSNSGRIIPPEQLARIFERFYQADSSVNSKTSGTGIGLALTQDLVSIYRGKIEVTSNSEYGTTFTITLPVSLESFTGDEILSDMPEVDELTRQLIAIEGQKEDRASEDQNISEERSNTDDDAASGTKSTILIVDDNHEIRRYLKYNLSEEYDTMEAINGTEGLKKALDCIPKLVICDVMMPGMDGYELCAEIKTDIRTCHIPVIILTAKASEEARLESIETGADAYIAKPFDLRVLKTRIKQLISSREQLKQLFRRELTIGPSNVIVESTDETLMKRILKVMSNNISDPDFGVEELGKEVGLSRTHLYRKIKQLNGSTAIEFVRNMRLQRAAQLFEQNKLYVAEVAYLSGFKELSYFRKIFKDFYGMSPKEYIRKCGGNPAD